MVLPCGDVARHWQEKCTRFSILFDEYPNLIDTTIFLFKCRYMAYGISLCLVPHFFLFSRLCNCKGNTIILIIQVIEKGI